VVAAQLFSIQPRRWHCSAVLRLLNDGGLTMVLAVDTREQKSVLCAAPPFAWRQTELTQDFKHPHGSHDASRPDHMHE
jgi:hypothetical protein